jgi:16S rRNA (cytidine1402-2'-O)-methyltransferase
MRAKPAPINTESATEAADGTFSVAGHPVAAPKATPGLYLVATPIGNLRDITLRALETLAGVDVIACEDTRITRRLTERYGIKTELTPYHEHNAAIARVSILARLAQGASVALVSDAGTPLVSDPGFKLVREACAAGYAVTALPGPSSVLTALLPRFRLIGFSSRGSCRRNRPGGVRGFPNWRGSMRRSLSLKRAIEYGRRWLILPRSSARARLRSAAS